MGFFDSSSKTVKKISNTADSYNSTVSTVLNFSGVGNTSLGDSAIEGTNKLTGTANPLDAVRKFLPWILGLAMLVVVVVWLKRKGRA
jgi:hypothetical protein